MKLPIYMDNHATTQVDPRVVETMLPYFTEHFGNSASRNHAFGWAAEKAVTEARERIALTMGADPREIIFTSGATESNNLALKGVALMYKSKGNHIITGNTEHKATLDTCKHLEKEGYEVTYLPVDQLGQISAEQVRAAITPKTILITLMSGNNEVGTLHPLAEIGKVAKEKGVIFHSDATQSVGKLPFDVNQMGLDLVSLSAHKMYGPKGIGALYVRRQGPRVRLVAQIDGGGHERVMRSGTLAVPNIVGFGRAAELCRLEMPVESSRVIGLRNRLHDHFNRALKEIFLNGHPTERLPGNLNISFAFVEGEALMMGISDIAVSSGSACTSASLEPSYVLKALGVGEELAHTSIRFGLGRFTTEEEVDYTAKKVIDQVNRLRDMSPLWEMFQEGVDLKTINWAAH